MVWRDLIKTERGMEQGLQWGAMSGQKAQFYVKLLPTVSILNGCCLSCGSLCTWVCGDETQRRMKCVHREPTLRHIILIKWSPYLGEKSWIEWIFQYLQGLSRIKKHRPWQRYFWNTPETLKRLYLLTKKRRGAGVTQGTGEQQKPLERSMTDK